MAKKIKGVIQVGDPILRQKARPILEVGKKEKILIEKMRDILFKAKGLGLAAPQIGEPVQLIIIGTDEPKWQEKIRVEFLVLFNPKIVDTSSEQVVMEEGCLSFMDPEIKAEVKRPARVEVEGLDERGKRIKVKAEGLLARVLQHEIDHLRGVLFTDRANPKTIRVVKKEGGKVKI